jgi:glycosyltransferase involved in cell wall biosynthesis
VTDNHLSLHVPSQVPCIIVHHGIAFLHGERDPDWRIRNIQLIVQQKRMFEVRNPRNTVIVSCSRFCSEEFERLYGRQYKRFRRFEVSHMSCMELYDPNPSVKTHRTLSRLPVVGGDWRLPHKGSEVMKRVREILKGEFEFAQMQVKPPEPFDARAFTGRKFGYYRRCDMMLCLSSHEGNSYFVLDGLYCNLPLVTTNVGLAQEIEGAVVLPWRQAMRDPEFVADAIRRAWQTAHPCEMRAQYDRKWSRKHYVQAMVKAIKTLTV